MGLTQATWSYWGRVDTSPTSSTILIWKCIQSLFGLIVHLNVDRVRVHKLSVFVSSLFLSA
uniref:Uncharacterized protein n=1 Tax=Anguilla anguilla TaxID=7936 RepID=A0A0E9P6P9_ANGAN